MGENLALESGKVTVFPKQYLFPKINKIFIFIHKRA